jgi:hypothetical protein
LEALFDALTAAATPTEENPAPAIPMPLQNEPLDARLQDIGDGLQMLLSIWDDSDDTPDELLGADVIGEAYEITKEVPVELIAAGGTREDRRAAFEAALEAIDDAIAADRTLGGTVDAAHMLAPRRNGAGLWTDGLPNILAADIRIRVMYPSDRSF